MNNENTTLTIQVPGGESLPPSLLSNIETGFKGSFEQAEKWRSQALAIHVTSLDQKAEMKLARAIRLELKNIRVAAEKTRKALKEDSLRMGKAIDGVYNILDAAIVPLERHLQEQEDYAERLAAAERLRIGNERAEAIAPYLEAGSVVPQLADMTPEQWSRYLDDTKILCEAKIEAARKAEAERVAREQAEAAERERLRIENERLVKEAAEREAKAKAEREAAEKARLEAEAKARAEKEAIEAKAKAEREAAERELSRIKAEADKAAKAEAERQAAIVAAEREKARIAEEARIKAEQAEAARIAQEQAKVKAEAKAAKKAARAPDKDKALAFAGQVRTLKAPEAKTEEGKKVMAEIAAKVEAFAKWIETQAATLN